MKIIFGGFNIYTIQILALIPEERTCWHKKRKKKISCYLHAFIEAVLLLGSVRAQVAGIEMLKTHVAAEFLGLRDLLKCSAAGNGNNTQSKEAAQRITSIFVQHD